MEIVLFIAFALFLAFIAYSGEALKQIMLLFAWGGMALSVVYALGSGLYRLIA